MYILFLLISVLVCASYYYPAPHRVEARSRTRSDSRS
jgi:hypothetical protein